MSNLNTLREYIKLKNYNGFLLPRTDEFQNEYVPAHKERLAWCSGFTGSAGIAIILEQQAVLFIDSRYTLQAHKEIDLTCWKIIQIEEKSPSQWLETQSLQGQRLAYCPDVVTPKTRQAWQHAITQAGGALESLQPHPIDVLWQENRPNASTTPAFLQPLHYAGQSWQEKVAAAQQAVQEQAAKAALISNPASLCWLLNIRGHDVPHTPLLLGYALIQPQQSTKAFVEENKITNEILKEFSEKISFHPLEHLPKALQDIADKRVLLDEASVSCAIADCLPHALYATDICLLPKALKNKIEVAGARAAHARDGKAVTAFLQWLHNTPPNTIDELTAEAKLLQLRQQQPLFIEPSFPTILGSAGNGAIVHYRATATSNRILSNNEVVLIDSGGQYLDGTTDVTRTIWLGNTPPPPSIKTHFTLVLKGHIALATARFPAATTGAQLDVLARQFLWQAGLDYGHGTGHGVGSFLSVHEPPQSISKRGHTALEAGMILSNEPGYYQQEDYGIRIENLVVVCREENTPFLYFETLTLVPLDEQLIDIAMLSQQEISWLAAYQRRACANAGIKYHGFF